MIAAYAHRNGVWRLLAAVAFVALSVLPAAALNFPALTGRVVDEANILNPQVRQELTDKLAALEAKTTSQLVVVTLKSLQGTSIEDFGVQLGRHWKIGQAGKNNGALLIVAPTERKVRVEVGYGLEGALTDAVAKFIIENSILPRFRAADFPGGIKRGTDDLIQVIQGEGQEFKQQAVAQQQATRPDPLSDYALYLVALGVGLYVAFALFLVARSFWQEFKRPGARQGRPSRDSDSWSSIGSGSSSSWSSSSSSSSDSFSGGGGSYGGGGSSGSW